MWYKKWQSRTWQYILLAKPQKLLSKNSVNLHVINTYTITSMVKSTTLSGVPKNKNRFFFVSSVDTIVFCNDQIIALQAYMLIFSTTVLRFLYVKVGMQLNIYIQLKGTKVYTGCQRICHLDCAVIRIAGLFLVSCPEVHLLRLNRVLLEFAFYLLTPLSVSYQVHRNYLYGVTRYASQKFRLKPTADKETDFICASKNKKIK